MGLASLLEAVTEDLLALCAECERAKRSAGAG